MKELIVGVTSGIALYKVVDLVSSLKDKFNITVIMTEHATKLINQKVFEKASGNKVATKLFRKGFDYKKYLKLMEIKHISLADKADLILIAPTTANTIAKLANGIADDLLTTTVLATKADVILCPSMNVNMWDNKLTQSNLKKLKQTNFHIIEPEYGKLACGYKGKGRLANIKSIEEYTLNLAKEQNSLKNKSILITAGATSEEIDPVRIITNRSSGKMGIAIADEAHRRGAKVTLIRANTTVDPSYSYKDIQVRSAADMFKAVKNSIKSDIMIHTAAVSDFTINKKTKKLSSKNNINLELTPTTKILEKVKKLNPSIFLIGFKAEYRQTKTNLIKKSREKIKLAKADLIVANDISKKGAGFSTDNNEVYIISKNTEEFLPLQSKTDIAKKILEKCAQ